MVNKNYITEEECGLIGSSNLSGALSFVVLTAVYVTGNK